MNWEEHLTYCGGHLLRHSTKRLTGTITTHGYVVVRVNKKNYYAHRVIWEMFNGPIPSGMFIDHIDGDRSNNQISNLRLASNAENSRNQLKKKSGVTWDKQNNKWRAQIKVDYKNIFLGLYDTFEEALYAYRIGSAKHHKQFSNTEA